MKCNFPCILFVAVCAIASCGPRETCPAVVESVATLAPSASATPPPDRSPVAAPANLVFEATINQARFGPDLATSLGLPTPDSQMLTIALLGGNVGPIVDTEQPIFAAAKIVADLDTPFSWAVSIPVIAFDIAKERIERAYELVKKLDGSYRLEAKPTADTSAEVVDSPSPKLEYTIPRKHFTCELAPAAKSAWRLVCGENEPSVIALGPYLTRTMPLTEIAGAAKVVFHPDPVRAAGWIARAFAEASMSGDPDFSSYEQWVNDLDQIEATVGDWKSPRLLIVSRLRSTASKFAEIAIDDTTLGPPPRAFPAMPRDTKAAVYTHLRVGHELAAIFSARERKGDLGISTTDSKRFTQLLEATGSADSTTFAWLPGPRYAGTFTLVLEGDDKKIMGSWMNAIPALNQLAQPRGNSATRKVSALVTLGKLAAGVPPGSLHIVLSRVPYQWSPPPTDAEDVIPSGKPAKLKLEEVAHLYIVANALGKGTVAFVLGDTDAEALSAMERVHGSVAKVATAPGAASLMNERSASGGIALASSGGAPFTFFTDANRANKTHTIHIDLPPEHVRDALRELTKIIFGSARVVARRFGMP